MWNLVSRCVPRSANSPEAGSPEVGSPEVSHFSERTERTGWRLALCLVVAVAGGCSRDARAVRLVAYSPNDEIYRITCGGEIQVCRDEALEACGGPYEVLETAGSSVEPERVSSAPGPRTTGPRYQRPKWAGQMVIACGTGAPPGTRTAIGGTEEAPAKQAPVVAVAPTLAADRLCIPGVTQECLGPAACRGAQACLAGGDGYGPCDCGNGSLSASPAALRVDAGAPQHR